MRDDGLNYPYMSPLANVMAHIFERFESNMQSVIADNLSECMNDLLARSDEDGLEWAMGLRNKPEAYGNAPMAATDF